MTKKFILEQTIFIQSSEKIIIHQSINHTKNFIYQQTVLLFVPHTNQSILSINQPLLEVYFEQ